MTIFDFYNEYEKKIFDAFRQVEGKGTPEKKSWDTLKGKVQVSVARGKILEKVAVAQMQIGLKRNPDSPEIKINVIDVNIFPKNPLIPVGHFDIENRITAERKIRGILDLLPAVIIEEDLSLIKDSMKKVAGKHGKDYESLQKGLINLYKMDQWDRGLGAEVGMRLDFDEDDLPFVKETSETILDTYLEIVKKRKNERADKKQMDEMFKKRADWLCYVFLKDLAVQTAVKDGLPIEWLNLTILPPTLKF